MEGWISEAKVSKAEACLVCRLILLEMIDDMRPLRRCISMGQSRRVTESYARTDFPAPAEWKSVIECRF